MTNANLTRTQKHVLTSLAYAGGRSQAAKLTKAMSRQQTTAALIDLSKLGLVEKFNETEWRTCGKDGEEKLVNRPAWRFTTAGYAAVSPLL